MGILPVLISLALERIRVYLHRPLQLHWQWHGVGVPWLLQHGHTRCAVMGVQTVNTHSWKHQVTGPHCPPNIPDWIPVSLLLYIQRLAAWPRAPGRWQHGREPRGAGSMAESPGVLAAWPRAPGCWQHGREPQGCTRLPPVVYSQQQQ